MGLLKHAKPEELEQDFGLVQRMLGGDEAAFEGFFEESFPPLYRFSLSRLRDPELAREVAQTAICNAIGNLRKYRGDAPITAWLFTICRHEISAHFRRLRRHPEPVELTEEAPEVRSALDELAAAVAGPEETLQRKDARQRIHQTLDQLPPRYGRALEWKYLEGLPVVEIAERLGVGAKAAESLLTRARVAFKKTFTTPASMRDGKAATTTSRLSAALLFLIAFRGSPQEGLS